MPQLPRQFAQGQVSATSDGQVQAAPAGTGLQNIGAGLANLATGIQQYAARSAKGDKSGMESGALNRSTDVILGFHADLGALMATGDIDRVAKELPELAALYAHGFDKEIQEQFTDVGYEAYERQVNPHIITGVQNAFTTLQGWVKARDVNRATQQGIDDTQLIAQTAQFPFFDGEPILADLPIDKVQIGASENIEEQAIAEKDLWRARFKEAHDRFDRYTENVMPDKAKQKATWEKDVFKEIATRMMFDNPDATLDLLKRPGSFSVTLEDGRTIGLLDSDKKALEAETFTRMAAVHAQRNNKRQEDEQARDDVSEGMERRLSFMLLSGNRDLAEDAGKKIREEANKLIGSDLTLKSLKNLNTLETLVNTAIRGKSLGENTVIKAKMAIAKGEIRNELDLMQFDQGNLAYDDKIRLMDEVTANLRREKSEAYTRFTDGRKNGVDNLERALSVKAFMPNLEFGKLQTAQRRAGELISLYISEANAKFDKAQEEGEVFDALEHVNVFKAKHELIFYGLVKPDIRLSASLLREFVQDLGRTVTQEGDFPVMSVEEKIAERFKGNSAGIAQHMLMYTWLQREGMGELLAKKNYAGALKFVDDLIVSPDASDAVATAENKANAKTRSERNFFDYFREAKRGLGFTND